MAMTDNRRLSPNIDWGQALNRAGGIQDATKRINETPYVNPWATGVMNAFNSGLSMYDKMTTRDQDKQISEQIQGDVASDNIGSAAAKAYGAGMGDYGEKLLEIDSRNKANQNEADYRNAMLGLQREKLSKDGKGNTNFTLADFDNYQKALQDLKEVAGSGALTPINYARQKHVGEMMWRDPTKDFTSARGKSQIAMSTLAPMLMEAFNINAAKPNSDKELAMALGVDVENMTSDQLSAAMPLIESRVNTALSKKFGGTPSQKTYSPAGISPVTLPGTSDIIDASDYFRSN